MVSQETMDKVVEHFNSTPNATVRETAEYAHISKSTVHNILTKYRKNSKSLEILAQNKSECHLRGGMATKRKYQMNHSK